MPKILIVAATKQEILPLLDNFGITFNFDVGLHSDPNHSYLSVLITGVGMVNTAYYMGKYFSLNFDYVINAGICGAFNKTLKIGEVVTIKEDTLCELGAEDDKAFIKYNELNLSGTNLYKNNTNKTNSLLTALKEVNAITVNKVHGNDESIKLTSLLFNPDVESMEGAAFFMACGHLSTNYFQVRAVSNYVEKRDKSKWNIPLAIYNLNNVLIEFILTHKA